MVNSIIDGVVILIGITIIILVCKYFKNKGALSFRAGIELTDLPVVTFYNNNEQLNFLLDTGANDSVINKSVVEKGRLSITPNSSVSKATGIDGTRSETITSCDMTIYRNKLKFTEMFRIIDLDTAFNTVKRESGVTIHGILGSKFFAKDKYVLDFDEFKFYNKGIWKF